MHFAREIITCKVLIKAGYYLLFSSTLYSYGKHCILIKTAFVQNNIFGIFLENKHLNVTE